LRGLLVREESVGKRKERGRKQNLGVWVGKKREGRDEGKKGP